MKRRIKRLDFRRLAAVLLIAAMMAGCFCFAGSFENNITEVEAAEATCGIYLDNLHSTKVADDSITLYANGGKVSTDAGDKNLNLVKLYTDVKASYLHKKGKAASGSVVAVISKSNEKPTVVNGKVYDYTATNIATASISKGVVTVKAAKEPGVVYLHVIDTGDEGTWVSCKVTVKVAPGAIELKDLTSGEIVKSATINIAGSITVHMSAKYKNGMGVWKELDDPELINMTIDPKLANVLKVTPQSGGNYTIEALGLNNGKKTSGTVIFTSKYNNKKTQIKITIENPVKKVEAGEVRAAGTTFKRTSAGEYTLTIDPKLLNEKGTLDKFVSAQIALDVVSYGGQDTVTTDKGKIFVMSAANGYDVAQFAKGKVKVTGKPSAAQKKVKLIVSADNKTLTVRFTRGTPVGTTAYFLCYYNNAAGGYQVVTIKTEAGTSSTSGGNT